jgi:hypothetical protein
MAFVITPGELESFVEDLYSAANELHNDMVGQLGEPEPDPDRFELLVSYEKWLRDVLDPFYQSNTGFWGSLSGSAFSATLERAEALRVEYDGYRKLFEGLGGEPSRPEASQPQPPAPGPNIEPALSTLKIVGVSLAIVAVSVVAIYAIRSFKGTKGILRTKSAPELRKAA